MGCCVCFTVEDWNIWNLGCHICRNPGCTNRSQCFILQSKFDFPMNLFALELFYNRADFNYLINYELKESKKKKCHSHLYVDSPSISLMASFCLIFHTTFLWKVNESPTYIKIFHNTDRWAWIYTYRNLHTYTQGT